MSIQGHHLNYLVSTVVPDATCKVSWPRVNWFWRRSFKGFYHIWAWWPYWSCDLDSLNIFLNMVTIGLLAFEEMFEFVKLW